MQHQNIPAFRSGFEQYYNSVLKPLFNEIETERKKYLSYFYIGLGIIFIVIPLLCSGVLWLYISQCGGTMPKSENLPFNAIAFALLVLLIAVSTPLSRFRSKSKRKIMPEFLKYFGDFQYSYKKYMDEKILNDSMLFGTYNRHYGDDYFTGAYKGIGITVSEEDLKMVTGSGKRRQTSTVFKGIAILLSMDKAFPSKIVVYRDWGFFNMFHKIGSLCTDLQHITLEDCVFEKEFEVYGSNQIEARYILTTAFMERMLNVQNAFKGKKLQFSFFGNKLLIAVSTGQDMFESHSIFCKATNRKYINAALEQIISILEIIEILKLKKAPE